ncbi:Rieske 2Fe-2S domain-containing protein [Fulvivirgaceae bacterium PWU5]|uniref:Rieske 2Fe-2S domain-containing protein n=1 Tax=Dawidia cretensis TaxID=2782350 RepID=A0AAP2DYS8_9BACT|nr:Rieske 2Fe-2S domain-containing protein [Dawidia cretensis]MBT1709816.1 Rieske 2Fe-2S domain-containing protein [Dawidia cretensis]
MEWIKIFSNTVEAREKLLSGKPRLLVVYGRRITLVHYGDDFYAVQDACTHNQESLSKGHVNHLGEIICPWHNYRFELKTGRAMDSSCRALATYPIKTDETGFFIGI